jgi:Methyltransferase domain
VLPASRDRILAELADDAVVLDVGGWGKPFARADWVLDLEPYETRGLYGYDEGVRAAERFTAATWLQRDICASEPWPFADDRFDFAICSHTLEDVRDPVRVCEELSRVATRGYVEVPSRLDEQWWGRQGRWTGWGHHHWLCSEQDGGLEVVFKPHILHGRPELRIPFDAGRGRPPEDLVVAIFWEGAISCRERVFLDSDALDAYLREVVPPGAASDGGLTGRAKQVLRRLT